MFSSQACSKVLWDVATSRSIVHYSVVLMELRHRSWRSAQAEDKPHKQPVKLKISHLSKSTWSLHCQSDVLTAHNSVPDLAEAVLLHVDVVEVSQLPRIILPIHILQHRDGAPIGHRGFSQRLVHLVLAPRILQEARGDEHDPAVAVLHSITQLRHHRAARSRVPQLEEAAEAFGLTLQVGHQLLHHLQVHLTVADADIIGLSPAGAARGGDVRHQHG